MSSHDFVSLWSPHLYHINLDNMKTQPGQQCKQVACVGSINMGGVNDSHKFLYPETATCDTNKLEEVIRRYPSHYFWFHRKWKSINTYEKIKLDKS